ncbi:MAG TPA: carbohydrate porin [Povalibacter sp.]|uniref:carbohydrate porin n=1 Tax=Povalibacter sp. TaxID=1962978 RepID=UPI002C04D7BA|nr:carbohydrate porin [Povalibacter sp.]HMN44142.1 carbohydrate porin [Povalibacter sp.]
MSSVIHLDALMYRPLPAIFCLLVASTAIAQEGAETSLLQVESAYTGEIWSQVSGGIASGERYLDNLEVTATVDGGQLLGLEGLQLFGYVIYNNGHAFADELSGAMQGISNIETTRAVRLYELWSQWQFGSGEQSIRFGLYDLNSEFDSVETAGLFINPSHGIGPDFSQSGRNGPSIFPVTGLAVRAQKNFGAWSIQAAALDGVPGDPDHPDRTAIRLSSEEGALLVGEVNYRAESGLRTGLGYWQYTAQFDDLTATTSAGEPRQRDDNAGAYAIVESPTFFANAAEQGLNLFVRVGAAQADINPVGRYLGAGAVYSGLFVSGRDQIGVAIAVAELGDPYRRAQAEAGFATEAREYNYELTYRFDAADWLALQTDVQYIRNPGMDPQLDSGWAVGLRFELSGGWSR